MRDNPAGVECYSGYTLNERPSCIRWKGEKLAVKSVQKEWREPGCRYFIVCVEGDRIFRLCYYVSTDRWKVAEEVSAVRKRGE